MKGMEDAITALWRAAAVGTAGQVVETAHQVLGCSILLGDPILSVTAAACPQGAPGWSWEDYIQAGYAPDFRQELEPPRNEQVILSQRCSGWHSHNSASGWDYILLDLEVEQGSCFHLVLIEDGAAPLLDQLPVLDVLCQALLAVLSRSGSATSRVTAKQFLGWLLEGDLREDQMLEVRASLMQFPTEGFFHLVTLDIASYRPTERSVSTISAKLEGLLGGVSAICGQRLVLLERRRWEGDGDAPQQLAELEELLRTYGLTGARSRIFYTLRDVPQAFRQTEEILGLSYCAGGRRLLEFSQMSRYLLAAQLPQEDRRVSACHPIVRRLAELDRESKFGYVDTLCAYLQSGQRAAVACARLHIHRNTLDYRLRKIEEQATIDWSDGNLLFQLYFSIALLEVLGRENG